MKLVCKALVAACLAASAGSVFADAQSTVTFGNLKITVIDLNPNDGIAAGITFMPDPQKYNDGTRIKIGAISWVDPDSQNDLHADYADKKAAWGTSNLSASVHTASSSLSASFTAAPGGQGFNGINVAGVAQAKPGYLGSYFGGASVPGFDMRYFSLSANTQVVFSVDASVSASTGFTAVPGELRNEMASAYASLVVAGLGVDGYTPVFDTSEELVSVGYPGDTIPSGGSASWSGLLSSSFSNLGTESTVGAFYASASIQGQSLISAVPEPSTYGMLLGGLGLIGAAARRRNPAA